MDLSTTITSLLLKFDIEYWEEGKNCSPGAINIECPLCDDHSNHCGIFRNSGKFHCWKCGREGDFAFLLAIITHRSKEFCQREIDSFDASFILDSEQQIQSIFQEEEEKEETFVRVRSVQLPKFFEPVQDADSPLLRSYIKRRMLSLEILIEHGCGVCCVGEYMNRLIAPVFFEGKLVGFQAADMTGKAEAKYKADTKDSKIKEYLYRWDMLDRSLGYVIIVEGLLDSWRLGGNTLASFGASLTDQQKKLLIKLKPEKLIFVPDGDAFLDCEREAQYFMPFIGEVHVVQLPYFWKSFSEHVNADPDSHGANEVWEMIQKCL